jgi:hypothetical protein
LQKFKSSNEAEVCYVFLPQSLYYRAIDNVLVRLWRKAGEGGKDSKGGKGGKISKGGNMVVTRTFSDGRTDGRSDDGRGGVRDLDAL